MTSLYPITENFSEKFSTFFKNAGQKASAWAGHAVHFVQNLPQQMQDNPHTAFAVILVANNLFFFATSAIANRLERAVENRSQPLSTTGKTFKHLAINGLFVGGSTLGLNLLLSELTKYRLSHLVLGAITATVVAVRLFGSLTSLSRLKISKEVKPREADLKRREAQVLEQEAALVGREEDLAKKEARLKEKEKIKKTASSDPVSEENSSVSLADQLEQLKTQRKAGELIKRGWLVYKWRKLLKDLPGFSKENAKKWLTDSDFSEWLKKLRGGTATEVDIPEAPPMDAVVIQEKFFGQEPTVEPQLPPPTTAMDLATLTANLATIKTFNEALGKALQTVMDVIQKAKKQQLTMSEHIQAMKAAEKVVSQNQRRLAALKDPSPVSVLTVIFKSTQVAVEVPFYSDGEYLKLETQLKTDKTTGTILRKSDYVAAAEVLLKRSQKELDEQRELVKGAPDALAQITAANNGIEFVEFEQLVGAKTQKLAKWKNMERQYTIQIKKHGAPVVDSLKVQPKTKSSLSSALLTTNPELQPWFELQNDHVIALLLNGLTKSSSLGGVGKTAEALEKFLVAEEVE